MYIYVHMCIHIYIYTCMYIYMYIYIYMYHDEQKQGFVQWGDHESICIVDRAHGMLFGPDVLNSPGIVRLRSSQNAIFSTF